MIDDVNTDLPKVTINKDWFEKNKSKFLKIGNKYNKEYGSDEEEYLISLKDLKFDGVEVRDDGNTLCVMGGLLPISEENIWIHIDIPLKIDTILNILNPTIKKMNKVKAVIEGVKP